MWPQELIDFRQLVGDRVLLRPYRKGDGLALYEAIHSSLDRITPWFLWANAEHSVEISESKVEMLADLFLNQQDLTLGIWDLDEKTILGGSGLHRFDWKLRLCEIGYWIRTGFEGKGYVIETVKLLEDFAFGVLGMNTVQIRLVPSNVRSQRVAERCGYRYDGTVRRITFMGNGELSDLSIFSKTVDEWEAK